MSEHIFVCQLTFLNIDTYSSILIESLINTNEMYSRVNEKLIYIYSFIFHNKDYISITLYNDVARGPQETTRLVRGGPVVAKEIYQHTSVFSGNEK